MINNSRAINQANISMKVSLKVGKTKISIPLEQLPPDVKLVLEKKFIEQTQQDIKVIDQPKPKNKILYPTDTAIDKETEKLFSECYKKLTEADSSITKYSLISILKHPNRTSSFHTRTIVKASLTRVFDENQLEEVSKTETKIVVFNMYKYQGDEDDWEASKEHNDREFTNIEKVKKFNGETESFIPVLYYGRFERTVYSVTPFCEHGTLYEFVKREELTSNIYFQIAFQVSRAISFLSGKNLIHADLHYDNILVREYQKDTDSEFGNILLVLNDFEYLTDCSNEAEFLNASLPTNPPDNSISIDWDVWCLGQTLHQIITGEKVNFTSLLDEQIKFTIFNNPKVRKTCLGYLIYCCLQRENRISAKCFLEALIVDWYSWLQFTEKLNNLLLPDKTHPHHLIIRALQVTITGEYIDMDNVFQRLPKDLRYIVKCFDFLKSKAEIPHELDCFLSHYFKAIALRENNNPICEVEFKNCMNHFPRFIYVSDRDLKSLSNAIEQNESSFILRCDRANKCLDVISDDNNLPNKKDLYQTAFNDLKYSSEFITSRLLFKILCRLYYMLSEEYDDFGLDWVQFSKIMLSSNDTDLLKIAADTLLKKGNQFLAISLLSKGIEISHDPQMIELRGSLYFEQRNYLEAERDFRKLLLLSPHIENHFKNCGYCIFNAEKESIYYSKQRTDEAIQFISIYLDKHPTDIQAVTQRIWLRIFQAMKGDDRLNNLKLAALDAISIDDESALLYIASVEPSIIENIC